MSPWAASGCAWGFLVPVAVQVPHFWLPKLLGSPAGPGTASLGSGHGARFLCRGWGGGARCVSRAGHASSVSPMASGPAHPAPAVSSVGWGLWWAGAVGCRRDEAVGCRCSSVGDKQTPSKHRASRRSSPPAPGGCCRLPAESWKPQAGVKRASHPVPSAAALRTGSFVPWCLPAPAGSSERGQGVWGPAPWCSRGRLCPAAVCRGLLSGAGGLQVSPSRPPPC